MFSDQYLQQSEAETKIPPAKHQEKLANSKRGVRFAKMAEILQVR
jgi:hypothetical protein